MPIGRKVITLWCPARALSRGHIREERAEALRHCRVRDNRITQARVRHARQHCGLDHGHDFTGLCADHGETQNVVATRLDQRLHEAARLRYRPRSQHGSDRQLRHANGDALALGFAFAQANTRERRIGEHAVRDEPITLGAITPPQIAPDDTAIVERDVGELWAAGRLANRPDIERARLEPLIDPNISAVVGHDTGEVAPLPAGPAAPSARAPQPPPATDQLHYPRPALT